VKDFDEYRPVNYRSTPMAFKTFMESSVWLDMKDTLEQALEMTRSGLEVAADWDSTLRLQQDADCLKRFLEMPRVIIEDLEVTREKEAAMDEETLKEMEELDDE